MDLAAVQAEVHDRWFDVDNLYFREDDRMLVIPFVDARSPRPPESFPDSRLVVFNVRDFEVDDRAEIKLYLFDRLFYGDGRLTITSSFPLSIRIDVDELYLEVQRG